MAENELVIELEGIVENINVYSEELISELEELEFVADADELEVELTEDTFETTVEVEDGS